jgi:predicted Fe-S protein YdhL (DUF1289 family)
MTAAVATPIASPCVRLCKFNEQGQCFGCFRSNLEVRTWAQLDPHEQEAVIDDLPGRRSRYWNMPLDTEPSDS